MKNFYYFFQVVKLSINPIINQKNKYIYIINIYKI